MYKISYLKIPPKIKSNQYFYLFYYEIAVENPSGFMDFFEKSSNIINYIP